MNKSDKNWADKFDGDNLDGLDWLEAGSELLGNIEERIYQEPRKKKLWPIFLLGLFAVAIVAGLFYVPLSSEQEELSTENVSTNKATKKISKIIKKKEPLPEEKIAATANAANNKNANIENPSTTITKQSNQYDATIVNQMITTNSQASKYKSNKTRITSRNTIVDNKLNTEQLSDQAIPSAGFSENTASVQHRRKILPPQTRVVFDSINKNAIKLLTKFDSLTFNQSATITFECDRKERILSSTKSKMSHTEVSTPQKMRKWFIEISAGALNMQLNDNFASAVSPASFYTEVGEVLAFKIGGAFAVDSRLEVTTSLGYERVGFVSGHNSNVAYFVSQETSGTNNNVSFPMATPLGSIEGSATINRANMVDTDQTDLLIDLTNQHMYQSMAVSVGLGYKLLESSLFSLNAEADIALKQLFNISNELILLETNNTDFNTTSTTVTNNQDSINKTLPELGIGLSLNRALQAKTSISIFYRHQMSLRPIHTLDEFSTGYGMHLGGLRYSF